MLSGLLSNIASLNASANKGLHPLIINNAIQSANVLTSFTLPRRFIYIDMQLKIICRFTDALK